jgi:hypothetical protein
MRVRNLLALLLGLPATARAQAGGDLLYSVSPLDNRLRTVDPFTAATTSAVTLTEPLGRNLSAYGISIHPATGELWAIVQVSGVMGRTLVRIDPATGVLTVFGNTGDTFAGITFDGAGTLWAVTGDGGARSESLFTLDLTTGAATLRRQLGAGNDGETIGFHPLAGQIFHASGRGTPNVDEILERIDLPSLSVTNVPLSGDDYEGATNITHWVGDSMLLTDPLNGLFVVHTSGVVKRIGLLDHTVKGLAFRRSAPSIDEVYGHGCAGSGGIHPILAGSPAPAAGTTAVLWSLAGLGGAPAILAVGGGPASFPLGSGCDVQALPFLFTTPIQLQGGGHGEGRWSIQVPLPAATPLDVYFQVAVLDSGRVALSNGLHLRAR